MPAINMTAAQIRDAVQAKATEYRRMPIEHPPLSEARITFYFADAAAKNPGEPRIVVGDIDLPASEVLPPGELTVLRVILGRSIVAAREVVGAVV